MQNDPAINLFLPYQLEWIRSNAPIAIGEKSRRIGWTFASAYRAVQRRIALGTDLFYSSADLGAAREFIEYCERFARVFNATANNLGSQVIDEQEGITALVLRFSNGSRIVAGSSNPKFFRSKGGDADADEYAFHADQRGLLKAMHATARVWGHQLRLWSTHNGEGSFFNELCKSARRKNDECGMMNAESKAEAAPSPSIHRSSFRNQHFRVSIFDAVNQGLVERIKGLDAPDENARREWLEELRASCPDEDTWREEYLCQPSSEQSALLSYAMIRACEESEFQISDFGLRIERADSIQNPKSQIQNPLFAGFDVGRKRDRSVLWVLEQVGDVFHTRNVRVLEDTPFSDQENLLHLAMYDGTIKRLCIDSTGMGAMLAERLKQRWGHRVEAVNFTSGVKSDLAMPLVRLFQDRLIRVPADAETREDLHKVRRTVTSAGNVRLDASRDGAGHADRFWALALAVHASEHAPVRAFTLARKPVGW